MRLASIPCARAWHVGPLALLFVSACVELKTGDERPPEVCAPPCHVWSKRFGGAGNQGAFAIATNDAGDVFVAGAAYADVDFGGGPLPDQGEQDIFVVALRADGSHIWSRRFGGAEVDVLDSLALGEPGGLYLTGSMGVGTMVDLGEGPMTSPGHFILKLDAATGEHLWHEALGAVSARVVADAAGDVVIAGVLDGSFDFGGGPITSMGGDDLAVVGLDASGAFRWHTRFGTPTDDTFPGAAVSAAGEVLVAGSRYGGPSEGDALVARFNGSGGLLWSHQYSGSAEDGFQTVAFGPSGQAVTAGTSWSESLNLGGEDLVAGGDADIIVVELNASNEHVYSKRFGGTGDQIVSDLRVDEEGNAVLTGTFSGTLSFGADPLVSMGGADVFVAELGPSGEHVFSRSFGDLSSQQGNALALGAGRTLLLAGNLDGTVDFGGGPLTSLGASDVFVAKFRR